MSNCIFCDLPVDRFKPYFKQIIGWVRTPRMDSLTMREYTGIVAHEACIRDSASKPADQPEIL